MNSPPNPNPLPEPAPDPKERNHRRNGKVAQLSKELRDRINEMMADGFTYLEIISALGEDGAHLTEDNLSNWKSGGYTEWIQRMERREDVLAIQEGIMDRALKRGMNLNRAAVQMAVTKAFELLDTLPADSMQKTMDSNNFTRLLNALVKAADAEIKNEDHELEAAAREAKLQREKLAPQEIGLSEHAREEIEENRFNPPS